MSSDIKAGIAALPVELLTEIFELIGAGRQDCYRLCLVNRMFREVSTPLLYRRIVLRINHIDGLDARSAKSLANPQYENPGMRYIRELDFRGRLGEESFSDDSSNSEVGYPNEHKQPTRADLEAQLGILFSKLVPNTLRKLVYISDIAPTPEINRLLKLQIGSLKSIFIDDFSVTSTEPSWLLRSYDAPAERLLEELHLKIRTERFLLDSLRIAAENAQTLRKFQLRLEDSVIKEISTHHPNWQDYLMWQIKDIRGESPTLEEAGFPKVEYLELHSLEGLYEVFTGPSPINPFHTRSLQSVKLIGCGTLYPELFTIRSPKSQLTTLHITLHEHNVAEGKLFIEAQSKLIELKLEVAVPRSGFDYPNFSLSPTVKRVYMALPRTNGMDFHFASSKQLQLLSSLPKLEELGTCVSTSSKANQEFSIDTFPALRFLQIWRSPDFFWAQPPALNTRYGHLQNVTHMDHMIHSIFSSQTFPPKLKLLGLSSGRDLKEIVDMVYTDNHMMSWPLNEYKLVYGKIQPRIAKYWFPDATIFEFADEVSPF